MNSMQGKFLLKPTNSGKVEADIFSDKSALVLVWMLTEAITQSEFSLRSAAKLSGVSLGQVQKVFANLVRRGILLTKGERTAKRFILKKPQKLLADWEAHYSAIKKVRMRPYRTSLAGRQAVLKILEQSSLKKFLVLGLHSAAKASGLNNTNLETVEFYLLDPKKRPELERLLELEPQERGYDVLIMEPYYKKLLAQAQVQKGLANSPEIITYLDLAHYPLRGREQADHLKQNSPALKKIKDGR
jgi:hypothetical protein